MITRVNLKDVCWSGSWKLSYQYPHACLMWLLSFCAFGLQDATDSVSHDACLPSHIQWSHALQVFPCSFYFSLVGNAFVKSPVEEEDHRTMKTNPNLFQRFMKFLVGSIRHPVPESIYGVRTKHWYEKGGDGVVSIFTQEYPKLSGKHKGNEVHQLRGNNDVKSMIWNYVHRDVSHMCTAFKCEKTWSYVWHVIEELHDRHLKLQLSNPELFSKPHLTNKIRELKPDMQTCPLHLKDCHLPYQRNHPLLIRFRPVVLLIMILILLFEAVTFTNNANYLSHSQAVYIATMPIIIIGWVRMVRNLQHGVTRIYMAQLSEVVFGLSKLVLYDLLSHGTESMQSWMGGEEGIEKLLLWVLVLEGVVNGGFFMEWSGVISPVMKLFTGWMSIRMMRRNLGGEMRLAELAGAGSVVWTVVPSMLWMLLNGVNLEKYAGKYSIQMGYWLGGIFLFMVAMMCLSLCPIASMESIWTESPTNSTGAMGEMEVIGWLLGTLYMIFVKCGDYSFATMYTLTKMKFMHYRMKQWISTNPSTMKIVEKNE